MHLLKVINTAKQRCEKYPLASNLRKMSAIARGVNISIELDTAVFVDSFTKRNSGVNGCFKLQKILKTSKVPNVMIHNVVKLLQNVDIAEAFNAFFASVFNHKTSAFSDFSDNEINTVQITQNDFFDALCLSTPGKGHDGISCDFLKTCCSELSFHVYKLLQSTLHSGIYPEEWKIAKITLTFKFGKKQDVTCYRPISLLSKLSLSFEGVIFKKLYRFIAPKLSTRQFGFLKGRSTITQLLLFLTEAYYANKKNNELYAFYLDYAEAFDTVPHHLITKLRHFRIGCNLLKLIQSYLIGQKQVVQIKGTSSTLRVIINGVSQGSTLGPVLFLVFIDNLPNSCSESLMFLFADDCKSISSGLPALERDFNGCLRWAQEDLMIFNLSKTNFIAFGKGSPGLSLNIENTAIPASNTVKDLGLTISSNLSWSSYIKLKVKSAYSIFYNLKRSMPPNTHWHTKITLFKSYIPSTVLYASEIRCPSKKDLTRLELLQSRVLKWAFSGSNYKERISKAKMLPISLEIQLRSLILLNRILNGFYSNFPIL